jgi:hypothetical protein
LSIRVELIEGRGERYWPRPGRLFAPARSHSYAQFSNAIDDAFARWDRSHLHEFELPDGTRIGTPDPESDNENVLDESRETLSGLFAAQQFIYVFDFGDDWTHLCTVVDASIDPPGITAGYNSVILVDHEDCCLNPNSSFSTSGTARSQVRSLA